MKELTGKYKFEEIDPNHQANLLILLEKVNKIRNLYNVPMTITSGYRSPGDQIRIYKEKMGDKFDISKIPMKSKHLVGSACDIHDPDKKLQGWILNNIKVFEDLGLYMEDFNSTSNWVHIQTVPPKSGKRFFIP